MNIAFGCLYAVLTAVNFNTMRVAVRNGSPVFSAIMCIFAIGCGFVSGLYFGGVL